MAVAALPFVAVALVLLLSPGIERSKEERESAEMARIERERAERNARIREQQRPRQGTGIPAGSDLAARSALLGTALAALRSDARERAASGELKGPIRRLECEPYPRTAVRRDPERDPSRRSGRYSCLAVTAEFGALEGNEAGVIGYPYRLAVHFDSGRFAYCKISGRPAEGAISARPVVTVPRACGGS